MIIIIDITDTSQCACSNCNAFRFISVECLNLNRLACFRSQPKAEWSARLGVVRLSSTSPWQQERRIVGMIKSPVEGTTVLVKLDRPVTTFSDFVRPVCLPSSIDSPSNASHCNTLGWARNRKWRARCYRMTSKLSAYSGNSDMLSCF